MLHASAPSTVRFGATQPPGRLVDRTSCRLLVFSGESAQVVLLPLVGETGLPFAIGSLLDSDERRRTRLQRLAPLLLDPLECCLF